MPPSSKRRIQSLKARRVQLKSNIKAGPSKVAGFRDAFYVTPNANVKRKRQQRILYNASPSKCIHPLPLSKKNNVKNGGVYRARKDFEELGERARRDRIKRSVKLIHHAAVQVAADDFKCEIVFSANLGIAIRFRRVQLSDNNARWYWRQCSVDKARFEYAGVTQSAEEEEEQMDVIGTALERVVAAIDRKIVSMRTVHELLRSLNGMIDAKITSNAVKTKATEMCANVSKHIEIHVNEGIGDDEGVDMAFMLPSEIIKYLRSNDLIPSSGTKWCIVLTGDGFAATSKQSGVQMSLFAPELLDTLAKRGIPAQLGVITFAFYRGSESKKALKKFLEFFHSSCDSIDPDMIVCTDLKFMGLISGMIGPTGKYGCALCTLPVRYDTQERIVPQHIARLLFRTDSNRSGPPCHSMCEGHGKGDERCKSMYCFCEKNCDGTHGYTGECEMRGLKLIQLCMDVLHCKMRITEKFIAIAKRLVRDLQKDTSGVQEKHVNKALEEWHMLFGITGAKTKADKATRIRADQADSAIVHFGKLQTFIDKCVDNVSSETQLAFQERFDILVECVNEFSALLGICKGNGKNADEKPSEEEIKSFEERAANWQQIIVQWFGGRDEVLYVHYMAHHVGDMLRRFGYLGKKSCEVGELKNLVIRKRIENQCARGQIAHKLMQLEQRVLYEIAHPETDTMKRKYSSVLRAEKAKAKEDESEIVNVPHLKQGKLRKADVYLHKRNIG